MRRWISFVFAGLAIAAMSRPAPAWDMAHGDAANTGLTRVVSPAAEGWPWAAHEVGGLGWDAGPVTAADGTVYVATLAGRLHAFARDGTPRWNLAFGEGLWAEASPAIGSDGSIYVAVRRLDHDRSQGDSHVQMLLKYSSTGQLLWRRSLPARPNYLLRLDQGIAHSAPKLWRHEGREVVMLSVVHGLRRAEAAMLLAYDGATGDLIDNLPLGHDPDDHDVTGSSPISDALEAVLNALAPGFSATIPCDWFDCRIGQAWNDRVTWRVPEIGLHAGTAGSRPEVVVSSDVGLHLTRGFAFDPADGYSELWSVGARGRQLGSAPLLLSNRVAAVGLWKQKPDRWTVDTGGPDGAARPSVDATVLSGPTLMSDGRLALVSWDGLRLAKADGSVQHVPLEGRPFASAAASCSHLYVATSRKLLSFERSTLTLVGDFPILGGGTTMPAIGPYGDLHHAIGTRQGSTLLMFWPAPEQPRPGTAGARLCQGGSLRVPTGTLTRLN